VTHLGSAYNWFVFWNYKGIYLLKLDYDGDELVRFLVVFCPWCNMFFSKLGTRVGTKLINSILFTAASAQLAKMFIKILSTPNASLVVEMNLDEPIVDNILFPIAALRAPLAEMGHLSNRCTALMAKSCMDPNHNHLGPNCNLQIRTAGKTREDQFLLCYADRRDIGRGCQTDITRDSCKSYSLFCRGLKGNTEGELLDNIIAGLGENRKKGSSDVQHKKDTLTAFVAYAKKNDLFVDQSLLGRLLRRYEDEPKQNSGNADNHNTSFYWDMPDTERVLAEAVRDETILLVQAEGKSG